MVPYANTIVTLEMPGAVLASVLENSITGISYKQIPAGHFLQVHGIRYGIQVDPSQETEDTPVEAKLLEVTLTEDTGKTCEDALRAYFERHSAEEITAKLEGRITVTGM